MKIFYGNYDIVKIKPKVWNQTHCWNTFQYLCTNIFLFVLPRKIICPQRAVLLSSWYPNYNAGISLMVQTEWKNARTEEKQSLGRCTAISYLSHEQMGLPNLPSSKCYLTVETSELSVSFPCLARQMKHRNFITHLLLAGKEDTW